MAHSPPPLHGRDAKRPKGILKNSNSYHRSPSTLKPVTVVEAVENAPPARSREATPDSLTERDLVLQNTLRNAGRRRSSSNQSRAGPGSRRQSHHELDDSPEASPRLKWDEANLYLTEQERTPKMKIDEPKTPFAKGYDPTEDEDELRMLDADDIVVDELDSKAKQQRVTPDTNIPDLDLGEPEAPKISRKESHSPKQVVVKENAGGLQHVPGDDPETPEEEEKHKKFEELRKKHYEMKNVANLLGHPEYLEDEDDDGDVELKDASEETNGISDVPKVPGNLVNGDRAGGQ